MGDAVSVSFFPRTLDGYCVDPRGEVRTYGDQGKLDLEAVCTTAFDGECAIYNQLGLKRLVSLHYVDGAGGAGIVEVNLSRFADANGAYAMFTKRVIADSDPAEPTTPKVLAAGGAGAIGTGRAYVWKDLYLVELTYNNETETPEALTRSSAKVLTSLAKGIGAALPGLASLPIPVLALPTEHRIVNGLQLVPKDALGIKGLGPLAVGYYAEGPVRYREVAMGSPDDAKALEAWKLVKTRPGALPIAGLGDEAVAVSFAPPAPAPNAPHKDYVFARKGPWLLGVGDEDLPTGTTRLTKEEKVAHLKAWLAAGALPAAPGKPGVATVH